MGIPGKDSTMAKELKPVDISHTPELLRLVEEVQATRTPRVLVREREELAVLMPVQRVANPRSAKQAKRAYADLASLRGAAGTLARPLPWKEMLEIAREDHLRS
jgi:hypothetical protein